MPKVLFALFGVIFLSNIVVEGWWVKITQYNGYNCEGWQTTTEYDNLCMTWPNFGYEISGIKLREGSCVRIYKEKGCTGESWMIAYPEYQVCHLPNGWNDHVLSVRDCRFEEKTIRCPRGSYIRRIVYGDWHEGVTFHCYKPNENTPTYSASSGGKSPSNPVTTSCPVAAHGHQWTYASGWGMQHSPVLACSRNVNTPSEIVNTTEDTYQGLFKQNPVRGDTNVNNNSTSESEINTQICNVGYALGGHTIWVDESGGIKLIGWICTKVLDPTTMCEPLETLGLVLQCDNSGSGNELDCQYSKTIGVGESKTMTALERQEMTFSQEFGYSFEAGIPGFSSTMSASLGFSQLVGYEWSQSDTTTWSEETTVSATMKVRPYTNSKLEQLIGKCSFYGTSVNFFRQTDVNVTSGETTVKYFSM